MTPKEFVKNDKVKWAMSIAYMAITTVVLVVREVTIPRMADGRTLGQAMSMLELRVQKIEDATKKIDNMEIGAAQRTEAIANLKITCDRIDKTVTDLLRSQR